MTLQFHAQVVSELLAAFACDRDETSESATVKERNAAAKQVSKHRKKANAILLFIQS